MNTTFENLKIFYTNADQFTNKKDDDMLMSIAGKEPDIILISEVFPKVHNVPISLALLSIPNYQAYLNFDPNQLLFQISWHC